MSIWVFLVLSVFGPMVLFTPFLVVMGRRGLGALRGRIGSVSFGVLRSVDVPVLTVK